jgi:putative spermidine/putrescine transport system substrate-binding protein
MQPAAQAVYAQNIAYGPTNIKALASLDRKVLDDLPTSAANAKEAIQFSVAFWSDQGEALEKRFAAWATQ